MFVIIPADKDTLNLSDPKSNRSSLQDVTSKEETGELIIIITGWNHRIVCFKSQGK